MSCNKQHLFNCVIYFCRNLFGDTNIDTNFYKSTPTRGHLTHRKTRLTFFLRRMEYVSLSSRLVFSRDPDSHRNDSDSDSLETFLHRLKITSWNHLPLARWILETRTKNMRNQVLGVFLDQYKTENPFQVILPETFLSLQRLETIVVILLRI